MDNNDVIENFITITGANTEDAIQFMSCCDFDLETAIQLYFASHGDQSPINPANDGTRPGVRRMRDNNVAVNGITASLSENSDDDDNAIQAPQITTQVTRMFDDYHDDYGWEEHPDEMLDMIMASTGMSPSSNAHSLDERSSIAMEDNEGDHPRGIYSVSEKNAFFPPEIQNHFNIIPGCSLPSYGYDGRYHFNPASPSEVRKQNSNAVLKALDNCCGVARITKRPVFICILEGGNDMKSIFFCRDVLQDEIVKCTLQACCQCFFQVINPTSEGLICAAEARLRSSRIANEAGVLNSIRKINGEMAYLDAQRAINISELMAMYHLEHEHNRPIAFMIHPLTRTKVWPKHGFSLHKYKQDIQQSHPPSYYDTQSIICEIVDESTKMSKTAFNHNADDFFVKEIPDESPGGRVNHQNSSVANSGLGQSPPDTSREVQHVSKYKMVENIDCAQSDSANDNGSSNVDVIKKEKNEAHELVETGTTIKLDDHLYLDGTTGAKKPDGTKTIRIRTPSGVISLPCLPSLPLYHLFLFAASHIHKKKANMNNEAANEGGDQKDGASLYSFIESPSLVNFSTTVQFLSGFPPKPIDIGRDDLSPCSGRTVGDCKGIRDGDIITPHSSG